MSEALSSQLEALMTNDHGIEPEDLSVNDKTDDTPSSRLSFHSDFCRHHPKYQYPIILQSDDGVCFRFCFDVLSVYSDFFANLKTLGQGLVRKADHIIPLPSATSSALAMFLTMINHDLDLIKLSFNSDGTPNLPPFIFSLETYGWTIIRDLLVIADAYEIDVIRKLMIRHFKMDDLTQLALAAACNDEGLVRFLSTKILSESGGTQFESIDQVSIDLFQHMAPDVLFKIYRVVEARRNIWGQLLNDIKNAEPMVDRLEKFNSRCWRRGGCPAVRLAAKQFQSLRNRAGNVVWDAIQDLGHREKKVVVEYMENALSQALEYDGRVCSRCHGRLSSTFRRAIAKRLEEIPASI